MASAPSEYYVAGIILVVSGFTDFLDGYIARKYDMITQFGKLIDPIADKLTQIAVAIALITTYPMMGLLVIIIVVKDAMLGIMGIYLFQFGVNLDGASKWGKVATAYFYMSVVILVFLYIPNTTYATFLILSSFTLMCIAFIDYAMSLYKLDVSIRESKHEKL